MATQSFLTESDMNVLEHAGEHRRYAKGDVILQQRSECDRLFFIDKGIVQIDFSRFYGNDLLAHLGQGDLFGEVSLLLGTRASANAIAVDDVEVLEIPYDKLQQTLDDEGLASRFYKSLAFTLARRLRSGNRD